MLVLPSKHRGQFKQPFGTLFSEFSDVVPQLFGRMICTVGDVVTHSAMANGIIPAVGVIDGFTMRSPYLSMPDVPHHIHILRVRNPAGSITDELMSALGEAVMSVPCMILVEGEEDFAILPLIGLLPDGTLVLYGQPHEGVVVCEVTSALRQRAADLLSCFVSI
ncbi:MAG TPA: GTP-dependent dephospho-CoA kinase family protein [Methanocorpusculum sp.]|nr:GTP-dependent dephospho-CoA kinase family protein [Methanocorpusculum sp.]